MSTPNPFADALCAGQGTRWPNPWDPPEIHGSLTTKERTRRVLQAAELCNGCPALIACAQRALTVGRGVHGIWAGVYIPPRKGTNGGGQTTAKHEAPLKLIRAIAARGAA